MMSVQLAPVPKRSPVLQLTGIRKSFNVGQANETEVLHGIDLTLFTGEFCAVIGPSGSGKSTLLIYAPTHWFLLIVHSLSSAVLQVY